MISPGASLHPASTPPHITASAMVRAFTMSPDFVMPPSARRRTPRLLAAVDATKRAVSWGMPTPATMRVVQMDPGPWPILTAPAPQSARNSTPAALVTLPAMSVIDGKAPRTSLTTSPTPAVWPWAVETATASTCSSTRLPTCERMASRSRDPSGLRLGRSAAPATSLNWESLEGFLRDFASPVILSTHIDSKSGRLDTAEAWFRQGLDKAQDEATRATIAVYYAGELAWRRRTDACDMLEAVLNSTSLARPLLMDLRSSYAQALAIAGRLEEARSNADEVVALLDNNSS